MWFHEVGKKDGRVLRSRETELDTWWWLQSLWLRQQGEGREVCSGLELARILPPDVRPSNVITLTLGNSKISKTTLSDSPVFDQKL